MAERKRITPATRQLIYDKLKVKVRKEQMLKPCPFCGSTNIKVGDSLKEPTNVVFTCPVAFVQCMCCHTAVGFIKFADETEREEAIGIAISLWNYRALEETNADEADDVGEWIHSESKFWAGGGYTRCSKCGFGYADSHFFEVEQFEHCPHCGKKMVKSEVKNEEP